MRVVVPEPFWRRRAPLAFVVVVALLAAAGAVIWTTAGGPDSRANDTGQATQGMGSPSPIGAPSAEATTAGPEGATASGGPVGPSTGPTSAAPPPETGTRTPSIPGTQPAPLATEEFTGTATDAKWGIYRSTAANGSVFAASQVRVAGGELMVVGAGKNSTGKGNLSGGLCWCAATGNQTFGIWQVRARFDAGAGYGPTIGLWPQSEKSTDGWINLARLPGADRTTAHLDVVWNASGQRSYGRTVNDNFTGWHVYTIEWRATFVKMYVDDRLVYDSTASASPVVIPKVPMHLYIQQIPGPNGDVPAPTANTPNEVITRVDWVRIYR
jgi:hypothetical protein